MVEPLNTRLFEISKKMEKKMLNDIDIKSLRNIDLSDEKYREIAISRNNDWLHIDEITRVCEFQDHIDDGRGFEELAKYISKSDNEITLKELKNVIPRLLLINKQNTRKIARLNAEELVIKYIKSKYNPKSIRNDRKKEIWIYKDGIYINNGISIISEVLRDILDLLYEKTIRDRIIEKIITDTPIKMEDMTTVKNPYLLPLKSNILNLKTMEIIPYNPKYVFFSKLDYDYDPNSDCPEIKKHLKTVMSSEEDILTFQEAVGNCLFRSYKYQKSVIMLGPGSTGKSFTLNLIKYFFGGEKNCASLDLHDIINRPYKIGYLFGKMLNISTELGEKTIEDSKIFKQLVGVDSISAERKYLPDIVFENYAKMFFACNNLPRTYDTSTGFKRRWLTFNFKKEFLDKNDPKYDPRNPNHMIKDNYIEEKLKNKEEMTGFLNFIIEGFRRLDENGHFSQQDMTDFWDKNSDSVLKFCEDNIEKGDYKDYIIVAELKNRYSKYCDRYELKKVINKQMRTTLERLYQIEYVQCMIDGERFYIYRNIKWRNN